MIGAKGGALSKSHAEGLVLLGIVEGGVALLRTTSYRQAIDAVVRCVVAAAAIRSATKSYNTAARDLLVAIDQWRAR